MPGKAGPVPEDMLARLRAICLALPETREERAWTGTRWRIRTKTFAHVLVVEQGWPPAYARAAGQDGPACVLTFRSDLAEFDPAIFSVAPFFKPVWWPDIAGVTLDGDTDWETISGLIAASYCRLAPKGLAERVRSGRGAGGAATRASPGTTAGPAG